MKHLPVKVMLFLFSVFLVPRTSSLYLMAITMLAEYGDHNTWIVHLSFSTPQLINIVDILNHLDTNRGRNQSIY